MHIVIAGATSALGTATASLASAAGHAVTAIGTNAERLQRVDAQQREVADLSDEVATIELAERLGNVDALVHLVGGWRGGGGLAGQSDDDWRWLERQLVTTLRNTTRALSPHFTGSSPSIAIVSSTGLAHPTAGNANYLAAKAAAETWLAAAGQGLSKRLAPDGAARTRAFRVKALVSPEERAAHPERAFDGYTDTGELASEIVRFVEGGDSAA